MKLVTYQITTPIGKFNRIGILEENNVIDINFAYARYLYDKGNTEKYYSVANALIPLDMIGFLTGGGLTKEAAQEAYDFVKCHLNNKKDICGPQGEQIIYNEKKVKLLAPVPRPNSLRDTISFEQHVINGAKRRGVQVSPVWYKMPLYYKGNRYSVIGTEEPIYWPKYTEKLDYELEFGCFVGKTGKNISVKDAPDYIAGYTIFCDMSARDIQMEEQTFGLGPAKGKDFDHGSVMGPCIVTSDELDVKNLRMTVKINGELWSEGNTSTMHWTFPQIIEHISADEMLYPGDFIGSGTVGGGSGAEVNRWIQPGDVIELEIDGIGIIKNKVVRQET